MAKSERLTFRLHVLADNEFAPGDVVRLKHGGPKMTVETVDDDGASVLWFDAADCLQSAFFSNAALELASVH